MIPILTMLCLSFAGAENCDFDWNIEPILNLPPSEIGYIDYEEKIIRAETLEDLIHEVKHLKCYMQWVQSNYASDVESCNSDLDYHDTYGKHLED